MSKNITQTIADFASSTRFEDLPADVVDYTKLMILDTLICGLAAGKMERTEMMHRLLEQLGGKEESVVFGSAQRYPSALASMANSEAMNALDADDTFFTSSHFAAFQVATALAEAERANSSGKDLILAVALGFDVNARINLASEVIRQNEQGELEWAALQGMGFAAMGSAVTSGVLRGLNQEQMRNTLGLVSYAAPNPVANTTSTRRKHHSFKYANYAGTTFAAVMSVMLAEQGYNAEQTCLDDAAFIRAQGCLSSVDELLLEDLGKKWWITETAVKYYPSCRYTHGPIDMLTSLMAEEGLTADDIEESTIFINPMGYALLFFREPAKSIDPDHCAPFSGAFNIPYVMALAALGRRPGPGWYSEESLQDPEVWSLANRFKVAPDEKGQREVVAALGEKIRRFRKTPASIVVKARGKEYSRSIEYVNGDPWSEETRATWERVTQKFHQFCQDLIPAQDIDQLTSQFRDLDKITHFRDEVDLLLVK